MDTIIFSHYQTTPLLEERRAGARQIELSLDLGMSTASVGLEQGGVRLPGGQLLPWAAVEEIDAAQNNCFLVQEGEPEKILAFSELTQRVYSLMPTSRAPTMLISGIPMHRIKGTDPCQDTREKINAAQPIRGRVLDTATSLGYTAIEAARTAEMVITVELDPTALEIARLNPWSQELFDHPKIRQLIGDSYEVVQELEADSFMRIIHDPPAFSLAGQLYAREFYQELHRVLQRSGRLFHYVGNPESKSGRNVTRGVVRRLLEAGFSRVEHRPRAFGVVAHK